MNKWDAINGERLGTKGEAAYIVIVAFRILKARVEHELYTETEKTPRFVFESLLTWIGL